MKTKAIRQYVLPGLGVVGLLVLLPGNGCPPPPTPTPTPTPGATTLVSTSSSFPPGTNFSPTVVGKTITVQVTGNATGSRIQVMTWDPNGNQVVNFNNPTSNVSSATFVSTSTGVHAMATVETGAQSSVYTTLITQSP